MQFNRRVRALLCGLMMQAGVVFGIPIRPQDVEQLMHTMHQQKGGQTNPDDAEPGGPPGGDG